MTPSPPGWPRISPAIYYDNASEAIDWLCRAFGFVVRIRVVGENGKIQHSELTFGEGLIMVSEADRGEKYPYRRSPGEISGGNTQNLLVYVDDVETHIQRARDAGATIITDLETHDYGEEYWADRGYECVDLGGHHWWFYQRLRSAVT